MSDLIIKIPMLVIFFGTMIAIGFAVLMITQKKMSIYKD